MDFLKYLKKPQIYFPLILIIIEFILLTTNYKVGTYLIGWDNVMPEFDLSLNLERSIHSIWQEYRGLGTLDGLAHAANLMHTIYIGILSFVLPDSLLRYTYTHLTHIIGGISFFFLLRKLTKNDNASFIGSLFYMFNLGVIQMYFAPLEVFTTHFAALPLLALLITNALEKSSLKNLIILFIGTFLMSPQGFVPTVFLAFLTLFGFMLLVDLIRTRDFKKFFIIAFIVFAANAFWLVPYTVSATQTGGDIRNSRINQFSSEEIFFRNKSFGDIDSVASLKGFMIDTIELDIETYQNTYFMQVWKPLSDSIYYLPLYLVFFVIMGVGIIQMIRRGHTEFVPYVLTFIVAFIFLANSTPVAEQINSIIRSTFPLVNEAFRFPFTKFITLFAFCFAVLFTLGYSYILKRFKKFKYFILGFTFLILIAISLPAFQGLFTSPYLKLELPKAYLNLFDDMQEKDSSERVVMFPVQTFWNWQYRSWGHRGSGFSWYGIPQPVMERAFDPWSPYDEQFYNEISYATTTQNSELFNQVLRKYDISYIVLDETVLNTLSPKPINYDSLRNFLAAQETLTIEKDYGELKLYKVNLDQDWIYSLDKNTTKKVYPNYTFEREDGVYKFTDNYITDTTDPSVVNLFPSLFSDKLQENLEFNVKNTDNEFVLTPKNKPPENLSSYILRVPSLFETDFLVPVEVSLQNNLISLTPVYPMMTIDGIEVAVNEDPIVISTNLPNPVAVEFVETKHKVNLDESQKPRAFLINPAYNSIKVIDASGATEVTFLDTSSVDKRAFYAELPGGKLENIVIKIPKIDSPTQSRNDIIKNKNYELREKISTFFSNPYSSTSAIQESDFVELRAVDGNSELTFYMPDVYHEASYILFSNVEYDSGLPMRFYLDNDTERRAEVETVFSKVKDEAVIVIPKSNDFFRGYGFHFTVKSVGKEYASSTVRGIEVYPFPEGLIKGIQFVDRATYLGGKNENPKLLTSGKRIDTSLYTTTDSTPNKYLALSQAYDIGWKAYEVESLSWLNTRFPFIKGERLDKHVLVNNWANGWETKSGGRTVMIFIPSYFQYIGIFITSTTLLILMLMGINSFHHRHKKRNYHHHHVD